MHAEIKIKYNLTIHTCLSAHSYVLCIQLEY